MTDSSQHRPFVLGHGLNIKKNWLNVMFYINNFLVRSDKNFNLGVIKPDFSMDIEAIASFVDLKKHK